MKKFTHLFFLFLFAAFYANGQSEMIIEPGAPGVINAAIEADTIAGGDRADPNRVYVLRRGFPYVLTGTIEFRDFHLRIKAEAGEGARPFIIVDSGGEPVSQIFRTRGDASLTLDGLHISGRDILGAYNSRIVRINSDDAQININDCIMEEAGQAGIRVQGDNPRIYVTNSIWRNMGRPFNPDNGRMIDNRGVPIDTLWMENSVVYNVTSRVYRSSSSGEVANAIFNQNTIWGSGQHGIDLRGLTNLQFTNNIYYNGVFLGRDEEDQDTLEDARFWIQTDLDTFDTTVNNILISNNNFHTDQEIIDAFPQSDPDGDVRISIEDFKLGLILQAAIEANGTGDTNIDEDLEFADEPIIPLQFIMASVQDTSSGSEIPAANPWDLSDLTVDTDLSAIGTGDFNRYRQVHNFTYPETAASFTAGTEGQPIGANMELITSAPDIFVENRVLYFPNPVKHRLYVQNLEKVDLELVSIFNLSGQQLQQFRNINDAVLEINTSNLIDGTYILTIVDQAGNISSRKFIKQ